MTYSPEEIKAMNKTARSYGAVGKNAILPQVVRQVANKTDLILDYGAGPNAIHTEALIAEGYINTFAYDIGANNESYYHTDILFDKEFDIIFASNVLNIQPDRDRVKEVIHEVANMVKIDGIALFNYPVSPRKSGLTAVDVNDTLVKEFKGGVERLSMFDTAVWKCTKGNQS